MDDYTKRKEIILWFRRYAMILYKIERLPTPNMKRELHGLVQRIKLLVHGPKYQEIIQDITRGKYSNDELYKLSVRCSFNDPFGKSALVEFKKDILEGLSYTSEMTRRVVKT